MPRCFAAAAAVLVAAAPTLADPDPKNWEAVLEKARGQTVYWHAWAGSSRINDYIAWAGRQMTDRHGVRVEHVKLSDAADAVSRVVTERAARRDEGGAVDLIWINGENFAAMKEQGLLFDPWAEDVPNWRYVNVEGTAAVTADFTIPTDGLEAPWGHGAAGVLPRHRPGRGPAAQYVAPARLGRGEPWALHLPPATGLPRIDISEAGAL